MNKRLLSLAVAGAMLLGLTGVASAGIPDETVSTASSAGGVVLITPEGTGGSIADAGATITVTVLDAGGLPVPNFPFQDIWLSHPGDNSIALCQGGSTADFNTNALGVTTISGVISGGGWSTTTQVYINGTPLSGPNNPPLTVGLNSPDINGDLIVNLNDFSAFGNDYDTNAFRSDLVFNGLVNLADFSRFGQTYFEQCP
jgi:ABC-type Fe3+-hydroxamate transport system substrate-binding protein